MMVRKRLKLLVFGSLFFVLLAGLLSGWGYQQMETQEQQNEMVERLLNNSINLNIITHDLVHQPNLLSKTARWQTIYDQLGLEFTQPYLNTQANYFFAVEKYKNILPIFLTYLQAYTDCQQKLLPNESLITCKMLLGRLNTQLQFSLGELLVEVSKMENLVDEKYQHENLIIGGIFLALSILISVFIITLVLPMAKLLSNGLSQMLKASERFSHSDFSFQITEHFEGEVGILATALNNMAHQRNQTETVLRETKNNFEAITKQSTEGITVADLDENYTFVNAAFCKMIGYSEQELLHMSVFDVKAPKQDHSLFSKSKSRQESIPIRVILQRKDGTTFIAEVIGKRINVNGQQRVLGTIRDITDSETAKQALVESEIRFRSLFQSSVVAIILVNDAQGKISEWNAGAERIFGYTENEVIGKNLSLIIPDEFKDAHDRGFKQAVKNGNLTKGGVSHELTGVRKDQQTFPIQLTLSSWKINNELYFSAIILDITDRKNAENKVRKSGQNLVKAQKIAKLGSWELDLVSNKLSWSDEIFRIFEIDQEKFGATYQAFLDAIHPDDKDIVNQAYTESLQTKKPYMVDHRLLMPDGRIKYVTERCESEFDDQGQPIRSIGTIVDITVRKQQEEHILHQAHYDALTNLPNRFLSLDRLSHLLNEAKRKTELVAVLFLDLDDFKKVNDTLGHETGDKLLIEAGQRLLRIVRSGDTVGRLGGDEFIILLAGISNPSEVLPVVEKSLGQFREAFKIDDRELILTASIGISVFPSDGKTASELLRNADSAMYNSKEFGRNTYSYYTDEMNKKISRRLALEEQMQGALARDEFYILYQPQIDIQTNKIIGVEALLRWKNPLLGDVFPDEFITISEQTGLIIPLGAFVLTQSLVLSAQWQKTHDINFRMAVNLSPRQFRDPNLVSSIEHAINKSGISVNSLELEITEGVLMSGHTYINDAITDLAKLGIELSMDDFGTGYSSLSYLRNYPFSILKIDRSFINDVTTAPADKALVKATISMAHNLGLKVVAEGVETEAQLAYLKTQGCEYAQGYFFSRPVSAEKITLLLEAQRQKHHS